MSAMVGEGELPKRENSKKKFEYLFPYKKEPVYAFAEMEETSETKKYRYTHRF